MPDPHAGLRNVDEIRDRYARAYAAGVGSSSRARHGVTLALGWVLGDVDRSPAYRRTFWRPAAGEVLTEEQAARLAATRPVGLVLDPDYAAAVEHALMWARGVTDDPLGYC